MNRPDGGFLSRWSRRKAQSQATAERIEPQATAAIATAPIGPDPLAVVAPLAAPVSDEAAPVVVPPPTLADVARLTRDSDFSRFVGADVDASVSNAALKKLFSDPHFNVMDGLDTYIDDYGKPDPIPPSMLRALNQAASLGLFDSEDAEASAAEAPCEPLASGPSALPARDPVIPVAPRATDATSQGCDDDAGL